mgnify:CR=1 FL=1
MPKRQAIFPADRHALYDLHQYSAAIRSGDLLFVSGQVGSREDGSPEPGLEAQVRRAFENLTAVLAAAGCSFADVVDVTVFIVDPAEKFERIWAVVPEYWGQAPFPNITCVGVTWLYGFDFEIKVVAKLP